MIGGAESITSPSSYIEKHKLTGSDDGIQFAVGRDVILQVEQQPLLEDERQQQRQRDSARASSKSLTEYKWENKTSYEGRILAATDKLIAYRLFNETTGEAVRVLVREQNFRHLIKDFHHQTVDLQWAVHAPLLAVLDANSNLYIYMMDENGQKLNKYLIIIQEGDYTDKAPGRLVWCPFSAEEGSEMGEHAEEVLHLLGVVQGKQVTLFMLNKIHEAIGRIEVTYERIRELKGCMTTIQLNSEITSCRISPDATALAAASADGEFVLFVIENWDEIQLVNSKWPLANNAIEEFVFLDSFSEETTPWKFVILSSDNGRRLALFDCDNWVCLAKLRFESPNQVTRMELLVEPSMNFLFIADYDRSNLYCIELSRPAQQQQPLLRAVAGSLCFAACTQINFCNPFICVVPCAFTEHYDSAAELSLEDDEQFTNAGDANSAASQPVFVSLVAITHRALLEINVELDRVFTVNPSVTTANVAQISTLQRSHISVAAAQHPHPPPQDSAQAMMDAAVGSVENESKLKLLDTYESEISIHKKQPFIENNNNLIDGVALNGNNFSVVNGEAIDKLAVVLERRFVEFDEKMDDLSQQLHKLREENEQLRNNQADNLSNVLEKISNELKSRDDRLEALVRMQYKEGTEQLVRGTESLLSSFSVNWQRGLDVAQTRNVEQLDGSVERVVAPQIETFCTQLFQQLNESFRSGLKEFMEQLKALSKQQLEQFQTATAAAQQLQQQQQQLQLTPMERLNRLLDSNQYKAAFELALNHDEPFVNSGDYEILLLPTVCKRVDPDTFFSGGTGSSSSCHAGSSASSAPSTSKTSVPPPPLPVGALFQLLRQLGSRLESETELKFRYLENALPALNNVLLFGRQPLGQSSQEKGVVSSQKTSEFCAVMECLSQALISFGDKETNREWKRRIRLLNQLIANMLTVNTSN